MIRLIRALVWVALALMPALPAAGQQAGQGPRAEGMPEVSSGDSTPAQEIIVPSPVLTLDWERLYAGSLWGRRVNAEIAAASRMLQTENTRIADDLVTEERDLTERRPTMSLADFNAAAEAFDQRATGIREAQRAKAQALSRQLEEERQAFIAAAMPLLDDMLATRGAVVVLDARVIIRGLAQADITAELGARVDAEIGDGAGQVTPATPVPGQTADGAGPAGTGPPEPGPSAPLPPDGQ